MVECGALAVPVAVCDPKYEPKDHMWDFGSASRRVYKSPLSHLSSLSPLCSAYKVFTVYVKRRQRVIDMWWC